MSTQEKLTAKQQAAIESLLQGNTYQQAAAAVGINEKTLKRWRSDPVFSATLQQESRQAVGDASRRLTAAMDTAVTTIVEIMEGQGGFQKSSSIRLRAAKIALDSAIRLNELNDIMERLEALEKRI